jgi:fumarate reductase flavoprotein subunit
MTKKLLGMFLITGLLMIGCFVENDPFEGEVSEGYTDNNGGAFTGMVEGTDQGFGGVVTVSLTLEDGYITQARVTGPNETEGFGNLAIAQAPAIIVSKNSVELDTLGGASYTTRAIKGAGQKALEKISSGGGNNTPGGENSAPEKMVPGTYGAKAQGLEGPFDVWITVSEYLITDITTENVRESVQVGQAAIPILIDRILKAQTTGVDKVSGATITSNALKTAVNTALSAAGASSAMTSVPKAPGEKFDKIETVDVLVIGSGAAGLSAAIEAAQVEKTGPYGSPAPVTVTVIEKEEIIGGSTKLSAGLIYAPVDESDKAVLADYFMYRAQGYAERSLLDFYAQNSLDVINNFIGPANIMMAMAAGMSSAPRSRMVNGQGPGLMRILEDKAKGLEVTIKTGIKATKLEKNPAGQVVRVRAESKNYNYVFNVTKGVVIATGGFDSDHDGLLAQHNPDSKDDSPRSSHGNVGEGITMGVEAGAATVFKGGKIGWGIIDPNVNIDVMAGANIITNTGANLDLSPPAAGTAKDGKALAAVDWYNPEFNDYVASFPGIPPSRQEPGSDYPPMFTGMMRKRAQDPNVTFWQISNIPWASMSFTSGAVVNHKYLEDRRLAYSASSLTALAEAISHGSLDPATLTERFKERGWENLDTYYVWKVEPSSIGSMGGLKINVKGQVVAATDKVTPIPGLYAAGEVANGDFYYQQ